MKLSQKIQKFKRRFKNLKLLTKIFLVIMIISTIFLLIFGLIFFVGSLFVRRRNTTSSGAGSGFGYPLGASKPSYDIGMYMSYAEATRAPAGINNTPSASELANLRSLYDRVIHPARLAYNRAFYYASVFRSREYQDYLIKKYTALGEPNRASKNSQHMLGQAADIDQNDDVENAKIFAILLIQGNFDQLIWEKGTDKGPGWVHVSWATVLRKRVTVYRNGGYTDYNYAKVLAYFQGWNGGSINWEVLK